MTRINGLQWVDHELHRHLHQQTGPRDRRQPADPRARPARAQRSFGAPVSEDRERGRHGHDRVLRRRRADDRGLHHAAARAGDLAGAGHRLPVVDERQRRVDDHGDAAPELRRQPGADPDPDPGQLGAQPAAAAGAAAGTERAGRRDDRRDVHGLPQRHAAGEQHHRLSRARRQAQARFDPGRADGRNPRRPPVRAARVARSRAARRARRHRQRRLPGAGREQLSRRGRHDQGPDGQRRPDRRHRPAFGRGIQAAVDQAEGRRDRAPRRCRQRRARRRRLRFQRLVQRQARRVHRHQGSARREHPRRRPARARGDAGHPVAAADRPVRRDRLRRHEVHHLVDPRSRQDADRGAADRHARDLPVPRQLPRRDHSGHRHAAVADRHVLRDARARLLDEPADAARARARDRPRRRRRDHRRRERRPAHEGGRQVAAAGGAARRARARRTDPGDDRRAGRGVRADRIPERPDRRAVHRIRVHARGRGDGLGDRRADAVADDVLALLQDRTGKRPLRAIHRPPVRARAPRLPARAAWNAGDVQRHRRHGHHAVRCDGPCST